MLHNRSDPYSSAGSPLVWASQAAGPGGGDLFLPLFSYRYTLELAVILREAVPGKKNPVLWHHYRKGALGRSAEEKYSFRELGGREWLVDFFLYI